ncbi:hypothetical protein [Nesterenkonia pannonica]|uniref:hypothetical protein n=1 Tax=Nesterenkonia pannonica TaxID=1548602 RepID=UPI0021644B4F|nr:hypothetical protein [Nesterenkonia pannonica]
MRVGLVVAYVFLLVAWPLWMVIEETFLSGENYVAIALSDPTLRRAIGVTLAASACAVVLNTVFGVGLGILLVRHRFPGRRLLSALTDLPASVSPIVVGLALLLAYGPVNGVLGAPLADAGCGSSSAFRASCSQ